MSEPKWNLLYFFFLKKTGLSQTPEKEKRRDWNKRKDFQGQQWAASKLFVLSHNLEKWSTVNKRWDDNRNALLNEHLSLSSEWWELESEAGGIILT